MRPAFAVLAAGALAACANSTTEPTGETYTIIDLRDGSRHECVHIQIAEGALVCHETAQHWPPGTWEVPGCVRCDDAQGS